MTRFDFIKASLKEKLQTQSWDRACKQSCTMIACINQTYKISNAPNYSVMLFSLNLSLSLSLYLFLPLAMSQGMSSHKPVSQCAVCQGSGSNWLTSCCYVISLSAFHSFSIPFQNPEKTAGLQLLLAGIRKKKKTPALCTKVKVKRNIQWNKVFMFVCMKEWESSLLLLPNCWTTFILWFYSLYLYLFPCFIWFPCFIACILPKPNCITAPWRLAFAPLYSIINTFCFLKQ